MVIGGIGYCDLEGNLQFHENVLEGLQVYNGAVLSGVYHPRSKKSDSVDRIKYHFMLSPIPYHLWPKTARFKIRLKQQETGGQTTGMRAISDFLQKRNVSIVYSFSSRSAHRYSTWDIHVVFDNISIGDLKDDYDPTNSYYKTIWESSEAIKAEMQSAYQDFLFSDDNDVDLKDSVICRVNTACHFFYYNTERLLMSGEKNSDKIYRPFTLRYNNGNFSPVEKGVISEVVNLLEPNNSDFLLPSICFAESDSHYLNTRIIIIPKKLRQQFFKISMFHERIEKDGINNPNSRGLLNYIVTKLQEFDYKMWKSSTLLYECRQSSYGSGKMSLFVESKKLFEDSAAEDKRASLEKYLDSLNENSSNELGLKPDYLQHIRIKARVEKVYPEVINRYFYKNRNHLIRNENRYDLFISYSHADSKYCDLLFDVLSKERVKIFRDITRVGSGDILSSKVEDGLRNSREFCILLSENSDNSKWVSTEWGAASILKKHMTIIRLPSYSKDKYEALDTRLKQLMYIDWGVDPKEIFQKYARDIIERRFKSMLDSDNIYF